MAARARAGAGLTRPELAVLLAGAKRSLAAHLLASDVPDQPALRAALVVVLPALAGWPARFDHLLDGHRLRRELIASVVANEVVDRMGVTFASRLAADTGSRPGRGGRRLVDRPGRRRGRRLVAGARRRRGPAPAAWCPTR